MTPSALTVWKGHGTENDFVIVEDLDGQVELSEQLIRALCDRRAGIGADGVLRVVRGRAFDPAAPPGAPEFFMDYRNADGSTAEMCGNGARVFVRHLFQRGLVDGPEVVIGTRAGAVWVGPGAADEPAAWLQVTLGRAAILEAAPIVLAPGLNGSRVGNAVAMPNPHVIVFVSPDELDALDLTSAPQVSPALPEGQNVEFVVRGDHAIRLRVHERGVGETRSCGTGIAAAVVAASRYGNAAAAGDGRTWVVDVPGGRCAARWQADGHVQLAGPAVIVGAVTLSADWLAAVGA